MTFVADVTWTYIGTGSITLRALWQQSGHGTIQTDTIGAVGSPGIYTASLVPPALADTVLINFYMVYPAGCHVSIVTTSYGGSEATVGTELSGTIDFSSNTAYLYEQAQLGIITGQYVVSTTIKRVLWISVDGMPRTDYTVISPNIISFPSALPAAAQVFVQYVPQA